MLIHNGHLVAETDVHLHISNRSFRYGDGCFESIRLINGEAPFLRLHYERLVETTQFLKINLPESLSYEGFKSQINLLAKTNNVNEGGYARLTIFRNDGGFYQPGNNDSQFIIEAVSIADKVYTLNETGLKIGIYSENPKAMVRMSNFKTNNSLHYVLASIFMKENGLDDCLLVNASGNVVESSNSNVFVVIDGILLTPPLTEGCLDGVARRIILSWIKETGIVFQERPIKVDELDAAYEIIVTNAVRGPRWIVGIGGGGSSLCEKMVKGMNG